MKGRPSSLLLLAVACALGCAQAFPTFSSFFGSKSKDSKTVPGAQVWPKGLNKGFSKGMAGKQSPLRTPLFSAAYTIKSPPHHLHKAAAPPPAGATPPTLEAHYEVLNGVEIVWQKPSTPARGVVVLFHGCSHSAGDFFPASTSCPKCLGLPLEMSIARDVLALGYTVLAISSADRERHKCWRPSSFVRDKPSEDSYNVKNVLGAFLVREQLGRSDGVEAAPPTAPQPAPPTTSGTRGATTGPAAPRMLAPAAQPAFRGRTGHSSSKEMVPYTPLPIVEANVPLYAIGISSGGSFAMSMAMGQIQFSGVVSQIMAVPTLLLQGFITARKAGNGGRPALPPVAYIHMPKDTLTARKVAANMEVFKAEGLPAKEVAIHPQPLKPGTLHELAGPEVTLEQSQAIHKALSEAKFLGEDGLLLVDPRRSPWRDALTKAMVPGLEQMRLKADASPVSEVLNLLWASHEAIPSPTTEVLRWMEAPTPAAATAAPTEAAKAAEPAPVA